MRYIWLLFGLLCWACEPEGEAFTDEGIPVFRLTSEIVELSTDLGMHADVFLLHDLPVILESVYDGPYLVKIFNWEGELLNAFGQVGRGDGPGQFISLNPLVFDPELDMLSLFDQMSKKLYRLPWKYALEPEPLEKAHLVDLSDKLMTLDNTFWFSDTQVVSLNAFTGDDKISFINPSSGTKKTWGKLPAKPHPRIEDFVHYQAHQGHLIKIPFQPLLAFGYTFADKILLIDPAQPEPLAKMGPQRFEPVYDTSEGDHFYLTGETRHGYRQLTASKRHILALFPNKTLRDTKNDGMQAATSQELHLFDLNGAKVRRYLLDKPIISLSVNPEETLLLALEYNEKGEVNLLKYELPVFDEG
ncbi:MAG: BF3164 family lipoprotein [Bacteroidota bacterium]